MKKYAICIGREFCSGGREIGKMLAKRLGIAYYDEIELRDRSRDLGIEDGIFEMFDEQPTRSFLFSVVMDPYSIDSAVNSGRVLEAQRKVIESATDEAVSTSDFSAIKDDVTVSLPADSIVVLRGFTRS